MTSLISPPCVRQESTFLLTDSTVISLKKWKRLLLRYGPSRKPDDGTANRQRREWCWEQSMVHVKLVHSPTDTVRDSGCCSTTPGRYNQYNNSLAWFITSISLPLTAMRKTKEQSIVRRIPAAIILRFCRSRRLAQLPSLSLEPLFIRDTLEWHAPEITYKCSHRDQGPHLWNVKSNSEYCTKEKESQPGLSQRLYRQNARLTQLRVCSLQRLAVSGCARNV